MREYTQQELDAFEEEELRQLAEQGFPKRQEPTEEPAEGPAAESTAVAIHEPSAPPPAPSGLREMADYDYDRRVRVAAAEVANLSWGKKISPAQRAAMARYALEAGLDPVRHLEMLGGAPYIKADGYIDKLAADEDVEAIDFIDITDNAKARKQWRIPERALAAYVCEITRRGRTFREASYAPKRVAKQRDDGTWTKGDEIGEEFPGDKARTSALRRCARLVVPIWSARLERIEQQLQHLYVQARAIEEQAADPSRVQHGIATAYPIGEEQ